VKVVRGERAARALRGVRLACGTALLALSACAGTETGNPSFKGSLGYDAYSSAPRSVALTQSSSEKEDAALRVDNAWLVLGDVELLRGEDCAAVAGSGMHVQGLGAGDHAAGQAPVTPFDLAAGQYCGARLPFVLAGEKLPAQAPDSLRDESIVLRGSLADGRSFELRSASQAQVLLRAREASFLLDDDHSGVLIGFDVAKWLGALDWSEASPDADGSLRVSEAQNEALLREFERALPDGVGLFRDADRDGLLDRDSTPIASGE